MGKARQRARQGKGPGDAKARQGHSRQGKARQGKARQRAKASREQGERRQGKGKRGKQREKQATHGQGRQGKARQGQGKARQGQVKEGKARQGKAIIFIDLPSDNKKQGKPWAAKKCSDSVFECYTIVICMYGQCYAALPSLLAFAA
jgi:hypothetical protein